MANEKTLKVCPNCGRILSAHDMLSDYFYMGFDSILNRFRCVDCNYFGPPVEVEEKEYDRSKFPHNWL